jgi:hypothetical protein
MVEGNTAGLTNRECVARWGVLVPRCARVRIICGNCCADTYWFPATLGGGGDNDCRVSFGGCCSVGANGLRLGLTGVAVGKVSIRDEHVIDSSAEERRR